jgi:ParB family chromosome partitioning protein
MLEMALIENIQRSDLNAIDVAMSYKRLIEECSLNQDALGERVGKDRTTVNNYLRLLRLPLLQ